MRWPRPSPARWPPSAAPPRAATARPSTSSATSASCACWTAPTEPLPHAAETLRLLELRALAKVLRPTAGLPGLHGHAQRPAARRMAFPPGRGGARDAQRALAAPPARDGGLLHLAALRPERHRLAAAARGRQRGLRGR